MENIRFGTFERLFTQPVTPEPEQPKLRFSPNDCLFEARHFDKFADLAAFEDGTIYDTSSGCFIPVLKAEYEHNGLHVFVDCHDYVCGWRQPFFYSTNKTLAQQLVPVQFMLHKDA